MKRYKTGYIRRSEKVRVSEASKLAIAEDYLMIGFLLVLLFLSNWLL